MSEFLKITPACDLNNLDDLNETRNNMINPSPVIK